MPQETNLNVSPYFDDFNEEKNIQAIIKTIFDNDIYVIIDVAAKFKDYSAKQIATIMVDEYNKIEQKPKIIKYFVFIDNNSRHCEEV